MKKIPKLKSRSGLVGVEPLSLPKDFISQVKVVISQAYKEKTENDEFFIYGNIYPKEVVLACSLKQGSSIRMTTAYASIDYIVGQDKTLEKKLYAMVDFFGSFFNEFFQNDRLFNYEDIWTDYEEGKNKFFVRINRDNIDLEATAADLLGEPESDES